MAWIKGWNCRSLDTYVTDLGNDTYLIETGPGSGNGEAYPVTRNGVTFGYTTAVSNLQARDRNAGNNAKLAGMHYPAAESPVEIIRIDLPATGDYKVRLAIGEPNYSRTGMKVVVRDNGTPKLTVTGDTLAANNFLDATGTNYTHANWVTSNAQVTVTFATTLAEVVIGGGATGPSLLAHFELEQVEAPPAGLTHYVRMTA